MERNNALSTSLGLSRPRLGILHKFFSWLFVFCRDTPFFESCPRQQTGVSKWPTTLYILYPESQRLLTVAKLALITKTTTDCPLNGYVSFYIRLDLKPKWATAEGFFFLGTPFNNASAGASGEASSFIVTPPWVVPYLFQKNVCYWLQVDLLDSFLFPQRAIALASVVLFFLFLVALPRSSHNTEN